MTNIDVSEVKFNFIIAFRGTISPLPEFISPLELWMRTVLLTSIMLGMPVSLTWMDISSLATVVAIPLNRYKVSVFIKENK